MESLAVAVPAIAFVPFLAESLDAIVQAFGIVLSCELQQSGFDDGSEKQPVALVRLNRARRLPFADEPFARLLVELAPYLCGRSQDSFGQESRIDQGLSMAVVEHQMVWRFGIDRVLQALHDKVDVLGTQLSLLRLVRSQLQPRSYAANRATHCLQIRHFATQRLFREGLERHVLLQRTSRQILQDRTCDARHFLYPQASVVHARGLLQQRLQSHQSLDIIVVAIGEGNVDFSLLRHVTHAVLQDKTALLSFRSQIFGRTERAKLLLGQCQPLRGHVARVELAQFYQGRSHNCGS